MIELCHLTDAQINNLHSDFRLIAEISTKGNDPDYVPSEQEIVHKEAFFQLLSALENDKRFIESWREREEERAKGMKGGKDTVGSMIIDRAYDKGKKDGFKEGEQCGFEKGEQHGIDLGEQRSILNIVLTLMHKRNMSSDDAMDFLDISQEKRKAILQNPLFLSAKDLNN